MRMTPARTRPKPVQRLDPESEENLPSAPSTFTSHVHTRSRIDVSPIRLVPGSTPAGVSPAQAGADEKARAVRMNTVLNFNVAFTRTSSLGLNEFERRAFDAS